LDKILDPEFKTRLVLHILRGWKMIEVSAKVAIVNLLYHHPEGITFPMLYEFRQNLIRDSGEPYIYVDTSEDSILAMIEGTGVVFLKEGTIKREPDTNDYFSWFFIDKYINKGYSRGFKKVLFKVASQVKRK